MVCVKFYNFGSAVVLKIKPQMCFHVVNKHASLARPETTISLSINSEIYDLEVEGSEGIDVLKCLTREFFIGSYGNVVIASLPGLHMAIRL